MLIVLIEEITRKFWYFPPQGTKYLMLFEKLLSVYIRTSDTFERKKYYLTLYMAICLSKRQIHRSKICRSKFIVANYGDVSQHVQPILPKFGGFFCLYTTARPSRKRRWSRYRSWMTPGGWRFMFIFFAESYFQMKCDLPRCFIVLHTYAYIWDTSDKYQMYHMK